MQGFSYLAKNVIGVGTYSKVHAVFPGATQGTTTWTAADSVTTPLPYASFVVTPVSLHRVISHMHPPSGEEAAFHIFCQCALEVR